MGVFLSLQLRFRSRPVQGKQELCGGDDRTLHFALELFRRIVFNAAVTNNDDHPRNHALRRTPRGWQLSPAYDLVPTPLLSLERRDLALTIGRYGRTASVYNLLSDCQRFGLSTEAARKEIDAVVAAVRSWRDRFHAAGVASKDIEAIAPAFLPECFFFEKPVDG